MRSESFLTGGGEMGALMRAHDWGLTGLGEPANWPPSLRVVVRLILNSGHPMYIFWGQAGYCLYNDAYRQSIGPERHPSSLGRPAREVWDEIWDTIGPQIARVMGGGEPTWHENALVPITRNGRLEPVYWTYSYSPIDDDLPGGVGGVLVVCTETTGSVAAQHGLDAERRRLSRLFEHAPSFIAVLRGADHRFEMVNIAYSRLVGGRHVVGKTVAEILPEAEAQGYTELLDTVFRTGRPFVSKGAKLDLHNDPDGPPVERFLNFIYVAELDEDGTTIGVFCEGHDVTESHLAQAQLAALTEGLQHRVETAVAERELTLARLHEAQRMDMLGRLTAGVAHDFNNLLTPILGGIDLLGRKLAGDERAQRIADGAMRSAERAQVLVQRLLAFGRRQMLQSQAIDLAALIAGMGELIAHSLRGDIAVVVDIPEGLPAVEADPHQFELAILNLCINARDAMPAGGRLTISARWSRPDNCLSLRVADEGEGMDEATLARAAEPYFTTKPIGAGTGLGLSMVHGFAAQSGGRLVLTSDPGAGTAAELILPVARSAAVPLMTPAAAEPEAACNGVILLVDDEELVRMAVADELRELGYTVVEAGSGGAALGHLDAGVRPDLLITDHLMPGMTGATLAKTMRTRMAGLRVLMITGYADLAREQTHGIEVMAKPFRQADVAQRVARMIGKERHAT